jgi:hypothetical protein
MAKPSQRQAARMRERIVQEAARVMAEEGVNDYQLAKRKAATHLGASGTRHLPQNREIQAALVAYQELFGGPARQEHLADLLVTAVDAMEFFERFRPRLVGALLDGTAGEHSDVHLHVFADTPEDIVLFLMDHDIPFDSDERRVRFDEAYAFQPVYRFVAGRIPVELTVFDERALKHPPRSRVDGQPMRRAAVAEVREMRDSAVAEG